MATSPLLNDHRAKLVKVGRNDLTVVLNDGRTITVPLDWYPRLAHATLSQRRNFRLTGRGRGIHWPELDEDLSVDGIILGRRAHRQ